jgi:hypothetical protein
MTVTWSGGGIRSGSALVHDNRFTGTNIPSRNVWSLANYRETSTRPYNTWGIADGTSVWYVNATEANGTHVDGHPPYLFDSGTVTGASVIFSGQATITDSTKNWMPNQWGPGLYSIKSTSPSSSSYTLGAFFLSNTATTLTYFYYPADDAPDHLTFAVGDEYQIHKVNIMMDQCGRGKGDLLTDLTAYTVGTITLPRSTITTSGSLAAWPASGLISVGPNRVAYTGISGNSFIGCTGGSGSISAGTPISSAVIYGTHTQTWPHQALEPCFSWNNVYVPTNTQWGMFVGGQPTTKLGIDFFNLGAQPPDSTPLQVRNTYVAALNGVAYVGTYVYPHPLTSP